LEISVLSLWWKLRLCCIWKCFHWAVHASQWWCGLETPLQHVAIFLAFNFPVSVEAVPFVYFFSLPFSSVTWSGFEFLFLSLIYSAAPLLLRLYSLKLVPANTRHILPT
jgi:hypothetical protein